MRLSKRREVIGVRSAMVLSVASAPKLLALSRSSSLQAIWAGGFDLRLVLRRGQASRAHDEHRAGSASND